MSGFSDVLNLEMALFILSFCSKSLLAFSAALFKGPRLGGLAIFLIPLAGAVCA